MSNIALPDNINWYFGPRLVLGFRAYAKATGYTIPEKIGDIPLSEGDDGYGRMLRKRNNLRNCIIKWNRLQKVEKETYAWKEIMVMDEHKNRLIKYLLNLDNEKLNSFCRSMCLTVDMWLFRLVASIDCSYSLTIFFYFATIHNLYPALIYYHIETKWNYPSCFQRNRHTILVDIAMALAPMLLPVDIIVWISEHVVPNISLFKRRAIICQICDPFLRIKN